MEKLSYRFIQGEVTKMRKEVEEIANRNEEDTVIKLYEIEFYDVAKKARFAWRKKEEEYEKGNKYQVVYDYYDRLILIFELMKNLEISKNVEIDNKENVASIKKGRGGKREGAGRNQIGERRVVSISLPDWSQVDKAISDGEVKSLSEYFRGLAIKDEGK